MRILVSIVLVLLSVALNAHAAPLTVTDLARDPAAHLDQRVTVTGVMVPLSTRDNDWTLCPTAEQRAAIGRPINREHPICIDLRVREDYGRRPEKYRTALVTITGLYWHRCLPELRQRMPAIAKNEYECREDGLNGWIGVEQLNIDRYVTDLDPTGLNDGKRYNWPSPLLDETERQQLDTFVQVFLRAVQTGDRNTLAELYPKNLRGFARVGLLPGNHLDWRLLSPELRITKADYIIFDVAGSSEPSYCLCFCRRSSCNGLWPWSLEESYGNLASPTVCHSILRKQDRWWLQ